MLDCIFSSISTENGLIVGWQYICNAFVWDYTAFCQMYAYCKNS